MELIENTELFKSFEDVTLPPETEAIDITDLKLMLGYGNSTIRDNVLKVLKRRARQHICLFINKEVTDFPVELDYIADELTAGRMSQLNSEGLKTESTDITRYDYKDDIYANWYAILNRWLKQQGEYRNKAFFML
ncbi:hypothetical protein LMOIWNZ_00003 [Enterococcus phage vB_OCPT_CCS3]|nr:hypothetical protein LMOIWNZ_00003 [Enterococcus phage vB_OCPT_CCS3]